MKTLFVFTLLFIANISTAQIVSIGSSSIALNSQQTLVHEAAGTTFLNPSLLLEQPRYSLWLNHYRPYNIAEINVYALAVNYSRQTSAFGAGYLEFGNKIYQDRFLCLAGAYRIGTKIGIGLRYKLRHIAIDGYGSTNISAFDLGFHIPASDYITIGFLIKNALASKISNGDESINREVLTAVRFRIPGSGFVFAEVAQEENFDSEYRFGFEYFLLQNIPLRIGTGLNTPESFSAGFGIQYSRFNFSYALQNHPALDQSHILSLTIASRK